VQLNYYRALESKRAIRAIALVRIALATRSRCRARGERARGWFKVVMYVYVACVCVACVFDRRAAHDLRALRASVTCTSACARARASRSFLLSAKTSDLGPVTMSAGWFVILARGRYGIFHTSRIYSRLRDFLRACSIVQVKEDDQIGWIKIILDRKPHWTFLVILAILISLRSTWIRRTDVLKATLNNISRISEGSLGSS
jgi:hypothetical protein